MRLIYEPIAYISLSVSTPAIWLGLAVFPSTPKWPRFYVPNKSLQFELHTSICLSLDVWAPSTEDNEILFCRYVN